MTEIADRYDPSSVESRWYREWETRGLFRADAASPKPPYSIVIPPPNVTGSLHMGHALNMTLQDILIRYKRMDGYNALWVPGTDHAGIATQNVVERQLVAEGKMKESLGREAFIARVWKWKQESGSTIMNQLRRLGASCDWSRERFTMDEGLSRAVREVFVRLWEEGLIYQGDYIVNWCPRCQTALSDLEVEREERDADFVYIKYGPLTLGTVRPETKLGDTGVAVHPKDKRYAKYVGQPLEIASVEGTTRIRVVADSAVDPKFGTGVIKVTPGHDPVDFEIGKRHNLPVRTVIGFTARLPRLRASTRGWIASSAGRGSSRTCRCSGSSSASSPTATRSASATAARPWSSRSSPSSGTCGSRRWRSRRSRRCGLGASGSCHARGARTTTSGWRISVTGASRASSGGDIASRSGTARGMPARTCPVPT